MPLHLFHFEAPFTAGVLQDDVLKGLPFPMQKLHQVHGTTIVEVNQVGDEREGDALITQMAEVPLLIKTADCIPVVCADPKTGWIAGIHAGWRGLIADIVPLTLARLTEKGVDVSDLRVGVGPSLGVECAAFSAPLEEIPKQYHWAIRPDGHVDLWAILEKQFLLSGVLMEHVEWMRVCTACSSDWFSWRRDADARRFGTYVVKKKIEG